jgi:hypothetical protein
MDEIAAFSELIGVDREEIGPPSSRGLAAVRLDALIDRAAPGTRRARSRMRLPRRSRNRLALAALVVVTLCASGWVAARQFELNLFSEGGAPPTPAELRSIFASTADDPEHAMDPNSIAAIGSFTSARGTITFYMARALHGSGAGTAYLDDRGKVITVMGYWWPADAGKAGEVLLLSSNAMTGVFAGVDRIWQIWGIAPDAARRLEVRFRDGTSETVPLHNGLFGYFVGGKRCEAGHEPSEVVALNSSGQIIGHEDPLVTPGC